jgi:hypothetical protein
MANEFIMRKGYKSLANSEITGSLTTTGNIRLPNSGKLYTWATHDQNFLDYDTWQASASAGMTISNVSADGEIYFRSGNALALTLFSSQNATFAGDVTIGGGDLNVGNSGTVNSVINMLGTNDSFIEKDTGNHLYIANNVGDKDIRFRVKDNTTNVIALTLDASQGGNATFAGDILMPTAGQQLRIGSFTNGGANSGEYANDDLVIGDGSITIYPHRRGDYGLDQTTATSTTFRSKLNIWSDNEDHITFGGASTHLVSAWESWKTWINNDSANNGTFYLYHTNAKTEFARFSGDGTTSFITGKFKATKELTVSSVAATNGSPATDNISVSGYGMIGNRGSVYLTNSNTDAAASIQIGVGGVHAASTKLLINPSNSIFSTNVRVGADSTYSLGTDVARWANVYADNFHGDGSNLTNITATSYSETDTLDSVADRGATTDKALTIGAGSTNGGRVLSQNYSGANRLGVISSNSSSGNFLIGYGAEGKVSSSGNFVSTYGNFSGGHAALSISGTHLRWYAEASNSTTAIGADLTLANVFSVDRVGNLDVAGEIEGASLDINGNADISGNISLSGGGTIEAPSVSGAEKLTLKAAGGLDFIIDSNGNGADDQYFKVMKHTNTEIFSVKETGVATISNRLVVNDNTSQPLSSLFEGTLVVQGGTNEDPIIAVTDVNTANAAAGVFHQSSTSPGFPALVINAASNGSETPLISARTNVNNATGIGGTEVFKVDGDGDATFAGHVAATEFRPTNIVTNKVVKFNGTQLDDSIMTDDGSNVSVAGDMTVTGTITAQEFKSELISSSIIYESGSTKFGDTSDDSHDFTGSVNIVGSTKFQIGASDQSTSADSGTVPATTGAEFLRIAGGYTTGQYTHEWTKVDRTGNLPLYLRESKGTANSFTNIARFGDHAYASGITFEVFGKARATHFYGDGSNLTNVATAATATTASNAMLLDGIDSTSFLRSDASDEATQLTINTLIIGSSAKIQFQNNDFIRYDDANGVGRFHFDSDGGTNNASVQAATFVGALSGNATTATSATTATRVTINSDFSGTYPMLVEVESSGDIYNNPSVTYNGTSDTLTSPNFAGNLTGNATTVTNGVYTTGAQTITGLKSFAGAIRITETGTAQHILIGNQDSGGTNKPSMIMGVNGALKFGYGNSWVGEGGTFTPTLTLDASQNATFAGAITSAGKISGTELEGTSLDINGNGDISGTLNVNGTLTTTGAGVNGNLYANRYFQNATGIPTNNLGAPTVTEMALFENQFKPQTTLANDYNDLADLTFFTRATGTSESDYTEVTSYSDDQKRKFLRTNNSSVVIPNSHNSFRVEFVARYYTFANAMVAYWSSQSHNTQVHVWKRRCSDNAWIQHTSSTATVSSWPGHLYLPFDTIPWNETNTTSTGHYNKIRIEFTPNWATTGDYQSHTIILNGMQIWGGYPSGRRTVHSYDQNGKLNLFGGINVPGDITINGTVDGVDISGLPTTFAPTDAEANVQSDWNATSGDALILNKPTIPAAITDYVSAANGGTFADSINVHGNILLTGAATTTNQSRTIDFTGFDKEGTTDPSDRAYIRHTVNTGGHAGSVLEISSQNDIGDGIAFSTHANSLLRHNGNAIFSTGHKPTFAEIETTPTTIAGYGITDALVIGTTSTTAMAGNTTIPTDHGDHAGLYLPIGGGTLTDSLIIKDTNSSTTTTGTTLLELWNVNTSDVAQQQSFIDFKFTDTNANFTPQVRIGAQVGPDADANAISKEGAGSFVVYTAPIGSDETGGSTGLAEQFRVSYDGTSTFAGNIVMAANSTVDGVDISGLPTSFAPTDAEANVQADWNETTTTSDAFILNKPTIPAAITDYVSKASGGTFGGAITVTGELEATSLDINGNADISGNLLLGSAGTENFISFAGTTGDTGGTTFIGEYLYGGTEKSELILYKGNDGHASTASPDRIRMIGANLCFDVYNVAQSYPTTMAGVAGLTTIRALTIDQTKLATFTGNISLSGTGIKSIQSGGDIALKTSTGEYALYGAANGNTNLYYNGVQHFRTGPNGVVVTGDVAVGGSKYTLTVNAPTSLTTSVVNDTINVTFTASTTTNIDNYLVFSSVAGGDYGLISVIPPADFGATMSIIDDSFNAGGTQAYRVYAVKNGVYSSPLTGSQTFTVGTVEPTNMSVINLNTAFYIQYDAPSAKGRFVTAYNIYKHEHATQSSLDRNSATLIYSGINNSYMYQISGNNNDNFHKFWVETTVV